MNSNYEAAYKFVQQWATHGAVATHRGKEKELVVFLRRCPKCGKKLPGMLAVDGLETCVEKGCDYERYPTNFFI
ncbi:MAG: hypothetical protein ACM37W_17845 [Actinomycetota bacterium]